MWPKKRKRKGYSNSGDRVETEQVLVRMEIREQSHQYVTRVDVSAEEQTRVNGWYAGAAYMVWSEKERGLHGCLE